MSASDQQARTPCSFHEQEQKLSGREDFSTPVQLHGTISPVLSESWTNCCQFSRKTWKCFFFKIDSLVTVILYVALFVHFFVINILTGHSGCGRLRDEHLLGVAFFKCLFTITITITYLCIGFEREAGEVQGEIYEKMQDMEIEGG